MTIFSWSILVSIVCIIRIIFLNFRVIKLQDELDYKTNLIESLHKSNDNKKVKLEEITNKYNKSINELELLKQCIDDSLNHLK
jgi:hypothetical protein